MEAISDTKMGIKKRGRFKKKRASSDPRFAKVHQNKAKREEESTKRTKRRKKRKKRIKRNLDL